MPPSQLKRLKASLREQGITGPAKSKKQKKAVKGAKDANERIQRHVALQQIRDSFNPFEIKAASRTAKFEHTTLERPGKRASYKDVLHRPGVTKSAGEEMRRQTLLPELQRRNKVGALIDRRIGEGDPGMTTEERALQRFAREKSRNKGANVFNLEASDDDEPKISLTHGGRRLDDLPADDFGSISGDDDIEENDESFLRTKRGRDLAGLDDEPNMEEAQPERKKSKKEVMQEVIAKSKLHKYERQKTKEDDDDLRDELDKGTHDILALLRGHSAVPRPSTNTTASTQVNGGHSGPAVNPDRQKLLDGIERSQVDKEYDALLKQMAQDARAKPSERTKTEEEKAAEDANRLRQLEERRLKRMRGEDVSDAEDADETAQNEDLADTEYGVIDEAEAFGFTDPSAQPRRQSKQQLVLDDEDEFELDEDLVANESDIGQEDENSDDEISSSDDEAADVFEKDEEDEFVKGILGENISLVEVANSLPNGASGGSAVTNGDSTVKFTYPCPQTHEEFLAIIGESPVTQLPTVIQRIRALYHPSLSAGNKAATAQFASTLVHHLSHMGVQQQPLSVIEQVIRHLHSLSRTYTEDIARTFRAQLGEMAQRKTLHGGDLVILSAIGSIYPTSDHFHQVVTPAMTIMARWLGLNAPPDNAQKSATGAFLVMLSLRYQRVSKRYVPEAVRFTLRTISRAVSDAGVSDAVQAVHIANISGFADLWSSLPSLPEILRPFLPLLKTTHPETFSKLTSAIAASIRNRRPLELHHHRPLAIRASYPKFETSFQPGMHYDVDADRAASARLRHEHARERKAALRELRKDANFIARAQLREKRARDEEYEKKYRRLVAEVQTEEGARANEYEREKAARKRKKKG